MIDDDGAGELLDLDALRLAMEENVPFNRWLGMVCVSLERGEAAARVPFRDELIGDPTRPALHGGILASIADAVSGAAVFTRLSKGDTCSTVDLRIDYLRPGRPADILCEAEVLRLGNQVAVTSSRLSQDGVEIAVSKAVFMIKRADR